MQQSQECDVIHTHTLTNMYKQACKTTLKRSGDTMSHDVHSTLGVIQSSIHLGVLLESYPVLGTVKAQRLVFM
jgi:hypothetical protein